MRVKDDKILYSRFALMKLYFTKNCKVLHKNCVAFWR